MCLQGGASVQQGLSAAVEFVRFGWYRLAADKRYSLERMNPTHTGELNSFAEVALGFCAWCEEPNLDAEREVTAAAWLAKLYAAALLLPSVEPENSDGLPDLPAVELAKAKSNLAYFNGTYYRECFDPDPTLAEAPVIGDIGDDLLDTYKDIKAGCVLLNRGQPIEALWHWVFLHRIHWGHHAAGALFALHCLSISKRE